MTRKIFKAAFICGLSAAVGCSTGNADKTSSDSVTPKAVSPALPSVDDVFNGYIEATGGRAAYEAHTARMVSGTFVMPKMNLNGTYKEYRKAPLYAFQVVDIDGLGKQEGGVSSERVAWMKSSMQGTQVFTGDALSAALRGAVFNHELRWKSLYKSVRVDSRIPGTKHVKLIAETPESTQEVLIFDEDSKLLVAIEKVEISPMGRIPVKVSFGNYKTFGKLKIPSTITQTMMSQQHIITITEIVYDPEIPAGTFELPDDVKKLVEKQVREAAGAKKAP